MRPVKNRAGWSWHDQQAVAEGHQDATVHDGRAARPISRSAIQPPGRAAMNVAAV